MTNMTQPTRLHASDSLIANHLPPAACRLPSTPSFCPAGVHTTHKQGSGPTTLPKMRPRRSFGRASMEVAADIVHAACRQAGQEQSASGRLVCSGGGGSGSPHGQFSISPLWQPGVASGSQALRPAPQPLPAPCQAVLELTRCRKRRDHQRTGDERSGQRCSTGR